jgi:hypothetical protein
VLVWCPRRRSVSYAGKRVAAWPIAWSISALQIEASAWSALADIVADVLRGHGDAVLDALGRFYGCTDEWGCHERHAGSGVENVVPLNCTGTWNVVTTHCGFAIPLFESDRRRDAGCQTGPPRVVFEYGFRLHPDAAGRRVARQVAEAGAKNAPV